MKFRVKNILKGRFTMDMPIDLCLKKTGHQTMGEMYKFTPFFQEKIDKSKS